MLGIAVATMEPTAAMGIATTFGVASAGTASQLYQELPQLMLHWPGLEAEL